MNAEVFLTWAWPGLLEGVSSSAFSCVFTKGCSYCWGCGQAPLSMMRFPDTVKWSNYRMRERSSSVASIYGPEAVSSLNTEMHVLVVNRSVLWTPEALRACRAASAEAFTGLHSLISLPSCANLPAPGDPLGHMGLPADWVPSQPSPESMVGPVAEPQPSRCAGKPCEILHSGTA